MGTPAGALIDWAVNLATAVEIDNKTPDLTCRESQTLRLLHGAPAPVSAQAALSAADLVAAADQPLTRLRSDRVAKEISIIEDVNVIAGRMVVPGGPWPGRYRLESVVFTAARAIMPPEFPPVTDPPVLHWGRIVAASQGYAAGSGAVAFPEQLSVTSRPAHQAYGVVFADKLTAMFLRVVPLLDEPTLATLTSAPCSLNVLRRYAFQAHEWGHEQGLRIETTIVARSRRLIAVVAELHADLAALTMLATLQTPLAEAAAVVLAADRLAREAWLPAPHAQVDAIAARHLLNLLIETGAASLASSGRLHLGLDAAREAVAEELEAVRAAERDCCERGITTAAESYLTERGWTLAGQACHHEPETPLARYLAYAATLPAASAPVTIR